MMCNSDSGIGIGIGFQGFSGMMELESELNLSQNYWKELESELNRNRLLPELHPCVIPIPIPI